MKKNAVLLLFLSLSPFLLTAQVKFEPGFFLPENATTPVECLIRNTDKINNPDRFEYKLAENSPVLTGKITEIQAFGIHGNYQFERHTVEMDASSDYANKMDKQRNPTMTQHQLFLRKIMDGDLSLYEYRHEGILRYFFKSRTSQVPEQLIYRQYYTNDMTIRVNYHFRQQLGAIMTCDNTMVVAIGNAAYTEKSLRPLFNTHNRCKMDMGVEFVKPKRKWRYQVGIRPTVSYASMEFNNRFRPRMDFKYEPQTTLKLGLENEFILPFFRNKWSFIFEPALNYYKSQEATGRPSVVNYTSLEIPVGVRHYFFLTEKSKIYLNGFVVPDFIIQRELILSPTEDFALRTYTNFAAGLGFDFRQKFNAELRYGFRRNMAVNVPQWYSSYRSVSFIVGYKLW